MSAASIFSAARPGWAPPAAICTTVSTSPDRKSTATAEQVFAALYGSDSFGPVVTSLGAAFSHLNQDCSRQVVFPGVAEGVSSDGDGWLGQIFGEFGYRFDIDDPSAPRLGHQRDGRAVCRRCRHPPPSGRLCRARRAGGAVRRRPESGCRDHHAGGRLESELAIAVPFTFHGLVGWRHAYGDVSPEAAWCLPAERLHGRRGPARPRCLRH